MRSGSIDVLSWLGYFRVCLAMHREGRRRWSTDRFPPRVLGPCCKRRKGSKPRAVPLSRGVAKHLTESGKSGVRGSANPRATLW